VIEFVAQGALIPLVVFNFGDSGTAAARARVADRRHRIGEGIFGLGLPSKETSQSV